MLLCSCAFVFLFLFFVVWLPCHDSQKVLVSWAAILATIAGQAIINRQYIAKLEDEVLAMKVKDSMIEELMTRCFYFDWENIMAGHEKVYVFWRKVTRSLANRILTPPLRLALSVTHSPQTKGNVFSSISTFISQYLDGVCMSSTFCPFFISLTSVFLLWHRYNAFLMCSFFLCLFIKSGLCF